MPEHDFILTVDRETTDVRTLMCHFQQDPFPGGKSYQLVIRDTDVVSDFTKIFGIGIHDCIKTSQQSYFLSYLFPMIGIKCGRLPLRFWANTIDAIEISESYLVLKGVCSHHVEDEPTSQP